MEECQRLLSVVSGADHLALRLLIELGLRLEEFFALRCNDVIGDILQIDEAIVEGATATVKTEEPDAMLYVPPDLRIELQTWIEDLNSGIWIGSFHRRRGTPGERRTN